MFSIASRRAPVKGVGKTFRCTKKQQRGRPHLLLAAESLFSGCALPCGPQDRLTAGRPVDALVHHGHQHQDGQQVQRHQADGDVLSDQAKEGRHQAGAHIGAGHLQADHRLGVGSPKPGRGGMDHAGVDGGAAQTDQDKARLGRPARGQQHGSHPRQDDPLPQAHHPHIPKGGGDKAAGRPAHRDADVEQADQLGRPLSRKAAVQHQVAARPQSGGLLNGAVAEEGYHGVFGAGDTQSLTQGQRLAGLAVLLLAGGAGLALPQRQAEDQDSGQHHLHQGDVPVAHLPALPAGQGVADQVGPHQGAHAPHAVQPAHVPAGIVDRHIVVQGRVHTAGAQAIGHRPQAQHPEGRGRGKSKQGRRRQSHTAGRHPAGAQGPGQAVAAQAGDDGPRRNDHRDHPCKRDRHPQLPIDGRPGRTQQRVGQAQTDEGQIDDPKQQMYHSVSS